MQQSDKLLEVKHLKKFFSVRRGIFGLRSAYQVRAVDDVSFDIRNGETLGLVGESGSGKTTLGRTILRAIDPTEGQVLFHMPDGGVVDVAQLDRRGLQTFRQHAQMIFQDPYSSLSPRMTVRDIIGEPLVVNHYGDRETVDRRIREVAELCGLQVEHLRRYPHAFSGGQRQRIGIARALAINPRFVVCDEPVSALDVSIQAQILNLLQRLQQDLGLTYLFIAHDLSVVEYISDRVAVMYLGKLVELAETTEVFRAPLHPYTEALMSAIPVANPHVIMQPVVLEGEIPDPSNPPTGCPFHPRCRYAQPVCEEQTPEWREYKPGHYAACHLAAELSLKGVQEVQR
ncbi:MAG: ABC transporter ATP-binding protein [Anaerolineae bacterium]|nr:ABC transporter ATP-binding protein [Anaerolineae bacterium]